MIIISSCALVGLPGMSGYYSKDFLLELTQSYGLNGYIIFV